MSVSLVHLDLSRLVADPLRSGIQRVQREAIRHWPGPARLVPCRVDGAGRLIRLPATVLELVCAPDDGSLAARAAERGTFQDLSADGEPLRDDEVKRLLNLELFFEATRADAHLRLVKSGVRVLWYVYDFLPFLRPDLFEPGTTRQCMHFLRALRGVDSLAFLSRQTRREYAARVARVARAPDEWPVFDPGADGLALDRQLYSTDRRDFVTIGTIEPRKNTGALLRAFETLWQRGVDAHLVVAGRLSSDASEARSFFARYAHDPRLTVLDQPADATIREALGRARAVVMPSEAEGFGLPPYEALHAGIPSVACAGLPSAPMMERGVILLHRMTPKAIAGAVEQLLDDEEAARLWSAAATARLPSWADFGRAIGEWAQTA